VWRPSHHPSQSKKFIFSLRFQHLAETNLIGSDMWHLEPVTVVVAGSGAIAMIGERVYSSND
jgi:hypothetical protein